MNINEFVKENKIRIEAEYADTNPHMTGFKADHWKVILRKGRKQMTTYFSKGYGHHGAEPTAEEILECLAMDASTVNCARDFEDWASDMGYDTDSRKAERTYKLITRQTEKLQKFLNGSFDTLMEIEC